MSTPPTGPADLQRLVAALGASGREVEILASRAAPWRLVLRGGGLGGPLELLVYLWPIRSGGPGHPPWQRRVGLHRRAERFVREHGAVTLLLGVDRERDVYAGWPVEAYADAAPRASAWVSIELLDAAMSEGLVRRSIRRRGDRPDTWVAAFRPERIGDYLVLARGEEGAGPPLRRAASRAPGRRRRFPLLESQYVRRDDDADLDLDLVRPGTWGFELPGAADAPRAGRGEERWVHERRRRTRRHVQTGFARPDRPAADLAADAPLAPGGTYLFWFAVGGARGSTIERRPDESELPALDRARLVVRVLSFDDGLELMGETRGTIELTPGEDPRVGERAATVSDDDQLHERTLFFPLRVPDRVGRFHLRCNVHLGSTVIQSRLVSCQVGGDLLPNQPALASDLDYALTDTLALERLAAMPEHELSLMVNGVGPSHQFRFYGADGDVSEDATIEAATIGSAIETARAALCRAAWGRDEEWDGDPRSYRYGDGATPDFEADLIHLARRGHSLYYAIARSLANGYDGRKRLEELSIRPGRIQIATTTSGLYVPAALFYDHPLVTSPGDDDKGRYRICDAFAAQLAAQAPLQELSCFETGCNQRADRFRVCPSGFWGFRHEIGWPLTRSDPHVVASAGESPRVVVGVSTDAQLVLRDEHVRRLLALVGASPDGSVARSIAALTPLLKRGDASLVYLYCHGGVNGAGEPFVELGEPGRDIGLTGTYLMDEDIRWTTVRPLVFINGCHTTALEPDQIFDLASGFVDEANALGVVGTELTVFEPLACRFAESALARYLDGSHTIGQAVRLARLELLGRRNPLGLVYVPFVATGTQLRAGT